MGDKILKKALQEIINYYQSQGMAGKIGFGKHPAVLVVDLQKGITDPQKPSGCNLEGVIDNTALLLDKARGKKEERLINEVVLRSLKRARYANQSLGHFGLAVEYYTHFTAKPKCPRL